MKFISYFTLFIVFASVLFISSGAGSLQGISYLLIHIIGVDTIILSSVIVLCTRWIVKKIEALKE